MNEEKILQVSLDYLTEKEIEELNNGKIKEKGIIYYKKDIGEKVPVGYFVNVTREYTEGMLGKIMQIASRKQIRYLDIDDIYEKQLNLLQ